MALFRRKSDEEIRRVPRKDRTGMDPFKAGAIAIIALVAITFFGFTKDIPFTRGFQVKAVFENATNIRTGAFVRVAGVNVGRVKKLEPYAENKELSVVTIQFDEDGLPLHKDATMKIRPQLFLEGNFFIDVQPGTPSSPKLDDGDMIPATQTSNPVQLDQVLTALQSDTRADLQHLLDALGTALNGKPSAADDRDQDPDVQGETAAESLNDTLDTAADAERNIAQVNEAMLGERPGDLAGLIKSLGTVAGALGRNEEQLKDLVTGFNTTMAAFASEETALRTSIARLPGTLRTTNRALDSLNRAFPPTRAFAREILPGVRETDATIQATFPWIDAAYPLLGPDELQGLARELRPTTRSLAILTDQTLELIPEVDLVNRCIKDVILPTGDVVIQDGDLTTGKENYKEFWYAMVGISGEGANFDGNGMYVRFQTGGGTQTFSTGQTSLGGDALFSNPSVKPIGTRPRYPGKRPPYVSSVPCYKSGIPDLNGPAANTGPTDRPVGTTASRIRLKGKPPATKATTKVAPARGRGGERKPRSVTEELIDRLNPFKGLPKMRGAEPAPKRDAAPAGDGTTRKVSAP